MMLVGMSSIEDDLVVHSIYLQIKCFITFYRNFRQPKQQIMIWVVIAPTSSLHRRPQSMFSFINNLVVTTFFQYQKNLFSPF